MTYDIYRSIFMIAAILSGLAVLLSIFFFFFFRIPELVGKLSGHNAKKAIKKSHIRNRTEVSRYEGNRVMTEKISTEELVEAADETSVLSSSILVGETEVLPKTEEIAGTDKVTIVDEIMFIHTEEVIE